MMKSKAGVSYQAACASWTKLGASLGSASDRHRAEAGWNTIECVAPLASRSRRREQLGSHGRIGQRRISGRAGTRTRPDVHPVQVVAEYGSVGPCRRLDRCQQQENRGGSPGQQLGHLVHLSRRGALSRVERARFGIRRAPSPTFRSAAIWSDARSDRSCSLRY